jgi:flavin reductase (DIM6/NTAB) family NADH-FMN oxidoreductase RutF
MSDKKSASFGSSLNPKTPVLVSCRGKDGRNNALAVVYACNCSYDPPMIMVGIVPSRYSYGIVKETGVFVANLVPESMRDAWQYLGSHSGRDEDKLAKLGLRLGEGVKVNAPVLLDCPVSIECTVTGSIRTGSHEMFIGKIEYVHADARLVDAEGKIDWSAIEFLKV